MTTLTKEKTTQKSSSLTDDGDFTLKISIELEIENSINSTESQCIEKYNAEIFYSDYSNHTTTLAGKVEFYIVNFARGLSLNLSPAVIAEEVDGYVFELYQAFFKYGTYNLVKEMEEKMEDYFGFNFAILHGIEILPAYRGQDIGKTIIDNIILFCNEKAGFICLKSFPKQLELFDSKRKEDKWRVDMGYVEMHKTTSRNILVAQKNLNKYYENCGFNKLKKYKGEGAMFYKLLV